MPLPSKDDLLKLDTSWRGAPFCRVEAKSLDTNELDFSWRGAPFYAAPSAGVTPVTYFKPIVIFI